MSNNNQKNNATLVIKRQRQVSAAVRNLKVTLNGDRIGTISAGQEKRFDAISAGRHYLAVEMDNHKSNELMIDFAPESVVTVSAKVEADAWGGEWRLELVSIEQKGKKISAKEVSEQMQGNSDKFELKKLLSEQELKKREAEQDLIQAQNHSSSTSWVVLAGFGFSGIALGFVLGDMSQSILFGLGVAVLGFVIGVPLSIAQTNGERAKAVNQARQKLNKAEQEIITIERQLSQVVEVKEQVRDVAEIPSSENAKNPVNKSEKLEAELRRAKSMLDDGLITNEEYQAIRQKFIDAL